MRIEITELKRCCFCIPLRRGLLFWVYLKLALGFLLLVYFIKALIRIFSMNSEWFPYIVGTIALIVSLIEIAFCILFIISAHRKSHIHMRIYYRYAIAMLILEVIALLVFVGLDTHSAVVANSDTAFMLEKMLEYNCIIFVLVVLQAYLVILVRSEVLKLERGTKFQFINHTTEPECKAEIIP